MNATSLSRTCPVVMLEGKLCGRPLHDGVIINGRYVCLMHSEDPGKGGAEFWNEVERILSEAGTGVADFTEFVFPGVQFAHKHLVAKCIFWQARFTKNVSFRRAVFDQGAHFAMTFFENNADFSEVSFTQAADFTGAWFKRQANFENSNFASSPLFDGAVLGDGLFSGVTFAEGASFFATKFERSASFSRATFLKEANFVGAKFNEKAIFVNASFEEAARFEKVVFKRTVSFDEARFDALADFSYTRFAGGGDFRGTTFRSDAEALPGPVFSLAEFCVPEAVVFYKTYLGQAVFHNCDVSKVIFSSVEWRERRGNHKRMLFEEEIDLNNKAAVALKPSARKPDERDYGLIAELYQQLKKNFDERRDYWTAGDFHYGEMEMKRVSSRRKNKIMRCIHSNLGLAAFYKYASQYGESYVRPALLLFGVLVAFGLLYPVAGLHHDSSRDFSLTSRPDLSGADSVRAVERSVFTYWQPLPGEEGDYLARWHARARLFWHGIWASVFIALFQRDLLYEPLYPGGRILAAFEQALTSTLFALFLLAVRRQFRR